MHLSPEGRQKKINGVERQRDQNGRDVVSRDREVGRETGRDENCGSEAVQWEGRWGKNPGRERDGNR